MYWSVIATVIGHELTSFECALYDASSVKDICGLGLQKLDKSTHLFRKYVSKFLCVLNSFYKLFYAFFEFMTTFRSFI